MVKTAKPPKQQEERLRILLHRLETACRHQSETQCEDVWMEMIRLSFYNKNWLHEQYCKTRREKGFPYN